MTTLHAQPYDSSANGFFFDSEEEYRKNLRKSVNSYGQQVEEFEIQFIDGEEIDCALASAIGLSQVNFTHFFELCDLLEEREKITFIIAVGECGYGFNPGETEVTDFDLDIYDLDTPRDLAEYFVDEGLMGDIPDTLHRYFDYDALARDLAVNYSETYIAGKKYVYAYS